MFLTGKKFYADKPSGRAEVERFVCRKVVLCKSVTGIVFDHIIIFVCFDMLKSS